jgi:hypothetical protein
MLADLYQVGSLLTVDFENFPAAYGLSLNGQAKECMWAASVYVAAWSNVTLT